MKPLLKKKVSQKTDTGNITIGFNRKGNKHLYSDTFRRAKGFRKENLKNLDKELANANFVKSSPISKTRKDGIYKFYYFKDSEKKLYYNVAETRDKLPNGTMQTSRFLYSVTNKIK